MKERKSRSGKSPTAQRLEKFHRGKVRRLIDVWRSGQVRLPRVLRWSRFRERAEQLRSQDCLQHSYSFTVLVGIMLAKFSAYAALDEPLMLLAALVHDHGEGELASDIPYTEKREGHDVVEYSAFVRRYAVLERASFDAFHRAYLLQFVFKDSAALLPEAARRVIEELRMYQRDEARLFSALEKWDYVLYALEQYEHYGNAYILAEVLSWQIQNLDKYAGEIDGFAQEVWTPPLRAWCAQFLSEHQHLLPARATAQATA